MHYPKIVTPDALIAAQVTLTDALHTIALSLDSNMSVRRLFEAPENFNPETQVYGSVCYRDGKKFGIFPKYIPLLTLRRDLAQNQLIITHYAKVSSDVESIISSYVYDQGISVTLRHSDSRKEILAA